MLFGLPRASTKGNPYGYLCGSPGPGTFQSVK